MAKAMMGAAQTGDASDEEDDNGGAPSGQTVGMQPETKTGTPANPMEQKDYEEFLNNCLKAIYSSDNDFATLKMILSQIAKAKDPGATLANVTVTVVKRVADSARTNGVKPDSTTLLEAGKTVLEDIASLAQRAGIYDYTEGQMEGAFYRAVDQYREMDTGHLDKDAVAKEFQAMIAAEKDGTLEKLVPGAGEAAKHLKPAVDKVVAASGGEDAPPAPQGQPQGMMPGGAMGAQNG